MWWSREGRQQKKGGGGGSTSGGEGLQHESERLNKTGGQSKGEQGSERKSRIGEVMCYIQGGGKTGGRGEGGGQKQ